MPEMFDDDDRDDGLRPFSNTFHAMARSQRLNDSCIEIKNLKEELHAVQKKLNQYAHLSMAIVISYVLNWAHLPSSCVTDKRVGQPTK